MSGYPMCNASRPDRQRPRRVPAATATSHECRRPSGPGQVYILPPSLSLSLSLSRSLFFSRSLFSD